MKLTSVASLVSCLLSFLAGLVYAGGFVRAPTPPLTAAAGSSFCDTRDPRGGDGRRVEARDVTLPDGRIARVVMVDEGMWE